MSGVSVLQGPHKAPLLLHHVGTRRGERMSAHKQGEACPSARPCWCADPTRPASTTLREVSVGRSYPLCCFVVDALPD